MAVTVPGVKTARASRSVAGRRAMAALKDSSGAAGPGLVSQNVRCAS